MHSRRLYSIAMRIFFASVAGPVRTLLLIALCASTLGLGPASAAAGPNIEWQVYNRFRYYKNAEIFREYLASAQKAATNGAQDWILETEHLLQEKSDRDGWAARNIVHSDDLCWNRGTNDYSNCKDYVNPSSHTLLVSVNGIDNLAVATCAWTLDPGKIPQGQAKGACADVKIEVPYSATAAPGSMISVVVTSPNHPAQVVGPISVDVRDYLVVGMGDSFGAGVGNPDKPATIDSKHSQIVDYGGHAEKGGYPERDYLPTRPGAQRNSVVQPGPFTAAAGEWLDMRCFRSQYGPQFRAALHLGIALPHAAVTYLDYSCDGARVLEGLLSRKKLDDSFGKGLYVPAQLQQVTQTLCEKQSTAFDIKVLLTPFHQAYCLGDNLKPAQKVICEYDINPHYQNDPDIGKTPIHLRGCAAEAAQRQIDYVMLSVGGNDIGFAPLLAGEALNEETIDGDFIARVARRFRDAETWYVALDRLRYLPAKYYHLSRAFDTLLPIRGKDQTRVFLAGYSMPEGYPEAGDKNHVCAVDTDSAKRAAESMDG